MYGFLTHKRQMIQNLLLSFVISGTKAIEQIFHRFDTIFQNNTYYVSKL